MLALRYVKSVEFSEMIFTTIYLITIRIIYNLNTCIAHYNK